jgi:hypothetical protein
VPNRQSYEQLNGQKSFLQIYVKSENKNENEEIKGMLGALTLTIKKPKTIYCPNLKCKREENAYSTPYYRNVRRYLIFRPSPYVPTLTTPSS